MSTFRSPQPYDIVFCHSPCIGATPIAISPFTAGRLPVCSRLDNNNPGACSIDQTISTKAIESRHPGVQILPITLDQSHITLARSLAMARDGSASRPPAKVVGGQRRRLARPVNAPRSNTMPILKPQLATASLVGSTANLAITDGEQDASTTSSDTATSPLETSQSMSNFCELL